MKNKRENQPGLEANDAKVMKVLKKDGWKIITLWERRLRPAKVERTLSSLFSKIR